MNSRALPAQVDWLLALVVLALAGQFLLLANPGYFSHDELQWGAFADRSGLSALRWVAWTGSDAFQYRPLTFNLWLVIGHFLFAHPHAYHALWVAIGTLNAVLLFAMLRRWELPAEYAFAAALLFVLNPYSAYVHGWVGTLADLLWLAAMLCIASLALPRNADTRLAQALRFIAIATLTALALLSKEAAVVIPGVCALAWLLAPEKRQWPLATVASALPVAIYLLLRVGVIDAGASGSSYAWSLTDIPSRWLEYHLYSITPTVFEPASILLASPRRLAFVALLCLGLYAVVFKAHWRLGLGLLAGGMVVLGPVLLLGYSAGQYGYGFGALACAIGAAAAWRLHGTRAFRAGLWLLALLLVWHGVNVQRTMRHVGQLQAVFSSQLAMLASQPASTPLRLRSETTNEDWVYQRLSHEIPAYRGQTIRRQIEIAGRDQPADYLIAADGSIRPLPAGEDAAK